MSKMVQNRNVPDTLHRKLKARAAHSGQTLSDDAIADLADLDLSRHAHVDLLGRAWKLRANITACDAMYVVLAEAIDATVVTCDGPLAKAPGHHARIEVIA